MVRRKGEYRACHAGGGKYWLGKCAVGFPALYDAAAAAADRCSAFGDCVSCTNATPAHSCGWCSGNYTGGPGQCITHRPGVGHACYEERHGKYSVGECLRGHVCNATKGVCYLSGPGEGALLCTCAASCVAPGKPPSLASLACQLPHKCREHMRVDHARSAIEDIQCDLPPLRRFALGGGNATSQYYANADISQGGGFKAAVIIVHGARRDPDNYWCTLRGAADAQTEFARDDVLVTAPWFLGPCDLAKQRVGTGDLPRFSSVIDPSDTDLIWNLSHPSGAWIIGGDSRSHCPRSRADCWPSGEVMSSYAVLDRYVLALADRGAFPHMRQVTVTGHSAGGQIVGLYALSTELPAAPTIRGPGAPPGDPGVGLRFVVMNPSAYPYFGSRRWKYSCGNCVCNATLNPLLASPTVPKGSCICDGAECTTPMLAVPGDDEGWVCDDANYTKWPYGLGSRMPPYVQRTVASAPDGYALRDVRFVIGGSDSCNPNLAFCDKDCWQLRQSCKCCDECWWATDQHSNIRCDRLDTHCPAMLQGPSRRDRAILYVRYLRAHYGHDVHPIALVPGIGHQGPLMVRSQEGIAALFAPVRTLSAASLVARPGVDDGARGAWYPGAAAPLAAVAALAAAAWSRRRHAPPPAAPRGYGAVSHSGVA